jgi:hypothetical protein
MNHTKSPKTFAEELLPVRDQLDQVQTKYEARNKTGTAAADNSR